MNFFEGYPFFLCLIPVLLAALLLGVLEKPLRWYSLAVSWLITMQAVMLGFLIFSGKFLELAGALGTARE